MSTAMRSATSLTNPRARYQFKGLTRELKALYDVGNNPNRMHGASWRCRPIGGRAIGRKMLDIRARIFHANGWLEAIRIYMANPSYLKEAAPKDCGGNPEGGQVNTNPVIRKILQFNMGGTPVPPLPSPDAATDPLMLPRGSVLGQDYLTKPRFGGSRVFRRDDQDVQG